MSFTINIIKKLPIGGLGGLFLLFLLFASSAAKAQSLTHSFRNTSLSDALTGLIMLRAITRYISSLMNWRTSPLPHPYAMPLLRMP